MEPIFIIAISVTAILLISLLAQRLRMPLVLGLLVAGILVGPASPLKGFQLGPFSFSDVLITEFDLVNIFASLGATLILFGIGLEFSVVRLSQMGIFTMLGGMIKIGLAYLISYVVVSQLGFPPIAAMYLALILSLSSTPIITKILEQKDKIRRPEVPFIITVLVLEDLVAVFALGILSTPNILLDNYALMISIFKVILTFIFTYMILSRLVKIFFSHISGSNDILVLATVSVVLIVSYLSEALGMGFSVGAFLAGSAIASSLQANKIEEAIKPFNLLFASFFFFSIGMLVDIGATFTHLTLIISILLLAILGKFFSSAISAYISGFTGRSACFAAISLLPLSELSLLIGAKGVSLGILSSSMLGIMATTIVISTIVSVFLINKENETYFLLNAAVPRFFITNARLLRATSIKLHRSAEQNIRYNSIISHLPQIGQVQETLPTNDHLSLLTNNCIFFAAISLLSFGAIFFLQGFSQTESGYVASALLLFAFVLSSTIFAINLNSSVSSLFRVLGRSISNKFLVVALQFSGVLAFALFSLAFLFANSVLPTSLAILPALSFAALLLLRLVKAVKSTVSVF
ncbi:Glutathione-regulated potassium-efflux system protein KefB [Candidatus Anstonella stagnisolia]|nr:Glutathione-regulated potassium-efflux system protein KefB [Candidatus Anstonella stagnisolia]